MEKRELPFHTKTPNEILNVLGSDIHGLTTEKANTKRPQFGFNIIPEKKSLSPVLVFLRQFKSVMVYILLIAAAISFFIGHYVDVYVMLFVILINSIIGFFQEYRAEKAIKALKKMIVPQAKVFRNNELIQVPAKDLVPGDIVFLEEGDRIPADARLIEIKDFRTVESPLTGESIPIDKTIKVLPEKTPLADQKNMVWLGTFVASGKAKAIVVSTGATTALGKLAQSIDAIKPQKTHFQEKSDALARQIAIISIIGAIIIFSVGFFIRGMLFTEIFLFALTALVSAVPEGLPAVLAIVLAVGARRMARRKAIVRERYSTETLGVVDTIISDKTGTITENTMTIQEIFLPGQQKITVTGTGWIPNGNFIQNNKSFVPLENRQLNKLLHIAASCNNSRLYKEIDEQGEEVYKILGDPTEAALMVLAEKAGLSKSALSEQEKRIDDVPFNPDLKYHASLSVLNERDDKKEIYVIGAPEAVIKHCTHVLRNDRKARLTKIDNSLIEKQIDSMTNKAMRVLGIAYKEASKKMFEIHERDAEDLIFVGVVAMQDPAREGVKEAIEKAKKAGIRVIMATGDHKNTAVAIAKEIGLLDHSADSKSALTGEELSILSEQAFENAVKNVSIFARLTPDVKLKIAQTLQRQGKIIAMTGDGVNDAPALKQADIGISMGKIGTDVARESSSIILADDNFASIINAIEEGRTVFINTRQTSFFLIATGLAEYSTIMSTLFIGLPLPLLPIQVLWLNIVTGGVTDVALSVEQPHHEVLEEKPRNKKENILNKDVLPFLILIISTMVVLTLAVFMYHLPDEAKARTAAFTAMSFTQLLLMFTMRSTRFSIFKIGFFSNRLVIGAFVTSLIALLLAIYLPFLQGIFGFVSLSLSELALIFVLSSFTFWFGELYKKLRKPNNH
jgi:Ca2+-transporting ATPase